MSGEYPLGTRIDVLQEAIRFLALDPSAQNYYTRGVQIEGADTPSKRRQMLRKLLNRRKHTIPSLRHATIPGGHLKLNSVFYEHLRRALERVWGTTPAGPHGTGTNLDDMPDLTDVELGFGKLLQPVGLTEFLRKEPAVWVPLNELPKTMRGTDGRTIYIFDRGGQLEFVDRPKTSTEINPTKEVDTMYTVPKIEITTRTYVNGVDISTMPKADIYSLIAGQERHIDELRAIKNKPKALVREIKNREAGIQALVDYLDKAEPEQAVSVDAPKHTHDAMPEPRKD